MDNGGYKINPTIIVIAFDPGGTTGCSIFTVDQSGLATLKYYGQFQGFTGLVYCTEILKQLCEELPNSELHVVYEDFYVVNVKNNNATPLQVIGAIRFWFISVLVGSVVPKRFVIHNQAPGERGFVEFRFKKPFPHVQDHARSSMLHAMAYLYKRCGEIHNYSEDKGKVLA